MTTARIRMVLVLVSLALLFLSLAGWANLGFKSAGAALVGSLVAWAGSRFAGYREAETLSSAIALTTRDVALTLILVIAVGWLLLVGWRG